MTIRGYSKGRRRGLRREDALESFFNKVRLDRRKLRYENDPLKGISVNVSSDQNSADNRSDSEDKKHDNA